MKKELNLLDIENAYKEDGATINSVAKLFGVRTTVITNILKESSDNIVREKQDHVGSHRIYQKCICDGCNNKQ